MKSLFDIDKLVHSIVQGVTAHKHRVGAEEIEESLKEIIHQLERVAIALEEKR
jgi:hypothetical protein